MCLNYATVFPHTNSPSPYSFPWASYSKASSCNAETQVQPLGCEDPLEKEMATHSILTWKISWMRSLVAPWGSIVHGVAESDTTERLHFHFSPVTISSNILNRITSSLYLTHRILSTAFFKILFLAALCCCLWAFSSCSKQRLLSSCSAWASHCCGVLEHVHFRSSGPWV